MAIDTEKMKGRLEEEKKKLETELASHGRLDPVTHDWQGSAASTEGEGIDPNAVADDMEELGTNVAVVEELEGRYRDVIDAHEKIEKGTYGICEVSGEQIPEDRLEANPAARTTVEHAQE